MPFNVQSDCEEHDENISKNHNSSKMKNSHQYETARLISKEKVMTPRGSRTVKLRDKSGFLKSEKLVEQNNSDHNSSRAGQIGGGGSVHHHKPWPSRKANGDEEMVKYMSNIPSYLQRMERGVDVQDKALNFGVIDWGLLEKWAYHQKQAVNGGGGCSSPTSNRSTSFSTFGPSAQSCRSTESPLAQRKKAPLNDHRDPSAKVRHRIKMMEDDSSRHVKEFSGSRISPIGIRHHQISEMDCIIGDDQSEHQHGKGKGKGLDMRSNSSNRAQPRDIGTSDPTLKNYESSGVANNMAKVQDSGSREAEKPHSSKQQNFPGYLPRDQHLVSSKDTRSMWDLLQESVSGRYSSIESTMFDNGTPTGVIRNSFSVNFPSEDFQFPDISHIHHSCPLPSTTQCDESVAVASTLQSEIEVPINGSKGKPEKHNQSPDEFIVGAVDRLGREEVKASNTVRSELSPSHRSGAGLNWIKRSSSLREGLSVGQMKSTACPDNSNGDIATANNRSRRSPLRRMLDPLLKSKNRTSDTPRIQEESTTRNGPSKLFGSTINTSTSQVTENSNSPSRVSTSSHVSIQDERLLPSSRQALLQLTWKDGIPLPMLSSIDNNVLAATMRRKNVSDKDNFECIYTILSINEIKKKSGAWINQRNKIKKHGLVSDIVGQLKVSSSQLKGDSIIREFVLRGAELIPAAQKPVDPVFNSELAAVIVKNPKEKADIDSLRTDLAEDKFSGFQAGTLQIEQNPENSSEPSIMVLLPSGVHGLSATGGPAPLIERWKSGGNCDCGGWDEGCILTILTDKIQGSKSAGAVEPNPTTDGTHQIELFVQGGVRENSHAFSMVARNEGLYTVEFRTSMSLLQAFAVCIATLYGRKPTDHSWVHASVEAKSLQDHLFSNNTKTAPRTMTRGGAPASYVPHHPPHSPVGRA